MSNFKNLPKSWKVQKIPEVLFFQEGPGVRKWQFQESGVKLLNVGNINKGKIDLSSTKIFLSEDEAFGKYSHFLVDPGDLLIACSGILLENFHNKISFVEDKNLPLCLNTSTMRFKSLNNNEFELRYFKYFLQTDHFNKQLRRLITGSAQLNFGPSHIKKIEITVPPLVEQKQIAVILDAADSLRQKDQQLVEYYTALSQSLFLEMFGDPVTNPMGWENVIWQDVLTIKNGKNQKKVANPNGLFPIYGSGGVMGYADEYLCEAGTTVIGRKGSINKPIYVAEKFWNVDTAFGLCAGDRLNSMFLYYFCTRYNFLKHNKATTLPSLTKADLLKVEMPLPPLLLQNQFAERINIIEQQKQQAQTNLQKSEALFNSLLQRAFTGELTADKAA